MGFDFVTCMSEANRCYREGKRAKTRRYLEAALKELARPWQRLPAWVVPGAKVIWTGNPPNYVYTVVCVDRSKPDWNFRGEMVLECGVKYSMGFHRAKGKRYWKRYIEKVSKTKESE